ncbi:MAG: GNAT family N-acetyltransferase [Atopobiaceae bacterium]|nr:GNAT family N-acetyltransferase [Atopobiaceae bacterium]
MQIRQFNGSDLNPLSELVGSLWHADHGPTARWQGADELCEHLSVTDKGFVAEDANGVVVGTILLGSACAEDANPDMRTHWKKQRSSMAGIASALGINARADAAFLDEESATLNDVTRKRGTDGVGTINLLILDPQARGKGYGKALFSQGITWLADHGAQKVRLITDEDCDWQIYEHWNMERVADRVSTCVPGLHMFVYEDSVDALLKRLVKHQNETDGTAGNPVIKESTPEQKERIGAFLNRHALKHGIEFVGYDYHIEQYGQVVAGISAWSLGSDVHIDTLAVDDKYRRQGYGSMLLAHVEELARRNGCTTASVDTFSFQAPDYYPAHGYDVVFAYPLDDGLVRTYFSKRLDG